MSVCPESVGNWSPSAKTIRSFSKFYPELFNTCPVAQLQEITVSAFSIQLGYNPRSVREKRFFDPIVDCNSI